MVSSLLAFAHLVDPVVAGTIENQNVATIVASQIRSQGFSCENPVSALNIAADSVPNHTVYILECLAKAYRVILVPDQAAQVSELN